MRDFRIILGQLSPQAAENIAYRTIEGLLEN